MSKAIGVVILFISVSLLLFLGISMISSIPEPEAGSDEKEIFDGLTEIIDMSYKGFYIVLIIIFVMAIFLSFKIGGKI